MANARPPRDSPVNTAPASPRSRQAGYGLLIFAALVIICAGLKTVAAIVAPTFLVLTLVITVQPVGTWLSRRGLPRWLASVVVLISVYALVIAVLGSAVWSLTRLVTTLPQYSAAFSSTFDQVSAQLSKLGVETASLDKLLSSFDLSSFAGFAQTALNTVTSGVSLLILILAMVFFLTFDAAGFGQRIDLLRVDQPNVADALHDFAVSVRKYWSVTTIFGLIVAVIDIVALFIIGVPLALTWGVLAFVSNYIPNIGFLIGLLPPAIIALLSGGVGPAVAVIITYTVVNVVIQTLIQPRFTGDAVGITATVAFLSLIFWAFLLGALGALLAIPATLLVKTLLIDHSPNARWLGVLFDSTPKQSSASGPPARRPGKSQPTRGRR